MTVPLRKIKTDRRERIRIGQLNAQSSSACIDEIRNVAKDHGLDIIIIQEPYIIRGIIPKMAGIRTYYKGNESKVATLVFDQNIEVLFDRQLTNTHHVVVKIHKGNYAVNLVNSYFQFNEIVETHLNSWDKIVRELGNENIIFAGDVNSKSLYWYSDDSRMTGQTIEAFNRGQKIEEFILENNMEVCNTYGELPTYSSHVGGSNIDITLAGADVEIINWKVYESGNSVIID